MVKSKGQAAHFLTSELMSALVELHTLLSIGRMFLYRKSELFIPCTTSAKYFVQSLMI